MESNVWQKYQKQDVQVLGVSVWARGDASAQAKGYAERHKLTFPVLVDAKSDLVKPFGVRGVPTNVVIGKDGKLAYVKPGYNEKAVIEAVDAALAAK